MELILWRHAEAKPGEPDETRSLTRKGRNDAAKMAKWFNANLPESCRIIVSPTMRTVQTAEALDRKFKTHNNIAPGAMPEHILAAAGWPLGKERVLIISHQPALGRMASLLIAGIQQDWHIQRGSAVWIAQRKRGDRSNFIKAIMSPELIGKN